MDLVLGEAFASLLLLLRPLLRTPLTSWPLSFPHLIFNYVRLIGYAEGTTEGVQESWLLSPTTKGSSAWFLSPHHSILTSVCLPVPLHGLFSASLPAHTCAPPLVLLLRAANVQNAHPFSGPPSTQHGPRSSFLPQPLFVKVFFSLSPLPLKLSLSSQLQVCPIFLSSTGKYWCVLGWLFLGHRPVFCLFVLFLFVVLAIPRK